MSEPTPLTPANELRASLTRDGFVRIPNAFSPSDLARFRTAAQHATARARAGEWPFVRTVPKQFPPWPVFAESYFGDVMVGAVTALLDCRRDDLVMELYNMLVCPPKDFALRWHRDDIGPDVPADVELERLGEPMMHAQWNLALYPDSSLVVVPGSHRRSRTEQERKADPYEDEMPGQVKVSMEAGDIVFYNNNILHRGVYDCKAERLTLHGTMGLSGADPARSRNILQHGIGDWAAECDFDCLPGHMATLATGMQRRLIGMGTGKEVGFSQQD
ncbi:hypothetical protein LTR48_006321 [Friedmanniomyces endolithicus]|nr:hypothetical protein LTR48_006321 [Friedmanniomyces endolithicus]